MDFSRRPVSLARDMRPRFPTPAATAERVGEPSAIAAGWRTAAISIAVAAFAFGLVFHHELEVAIQTWLWTTAYNHCFLILPLIAFLLWERRAVFPAVSPRPVFWPLAALPVLSAMWLVAAVLDINEGRQFVVVAMFEVVLLATLGVRAFRLLMAPLLFLFFLVPSGEFLIPSLQKVTADIAVHGLQLLNIPVYSEGVMIDIPEGRFEIAEACAGLRFLIASIVFGFFFAVVMYRSLLRRAVFIALSLIVPVGANGLRALGTIALAHVEGSAAAVEADHILYGWLFFSLVILLLIVIGIRFADGGDRLPPLAPATGPSAPSWRFAAAVACGLLLALLGPAYGARLNAQFGAAALPVVDLAQPRPPWRAAGADTPAWQPMIRGGAEHEWLNSFEEPRSGIVVRYVGLYRLHPVGNALTRTDNRIADDVTWQLQSQEQEQIRVGDSVAAVTRSRIVASLRRRLVYSFYIVDGAIAAGPIQAKLLQARAVLLRRASLAALVAVSASSDDPDFPASAQLRQFLEASRPLLGDLEALSSGNLAHAGASRRN
jgi:exosortase A